jgi:hexosaminidase
VIVAGDADILMPLPERVTLGDDAGLPPGARLEPAYAGVCTSRIAGGAERCLAAMAAAAVISGAPAGGLVRPLLIDCAEASPAFPALGDDESYALDVAATGVRLVAATEWGVLRGLATLTQLCGGGAVPGQRIVDRPRFAWRGLMLDVARHFIPLPHLLRTLDAMAVFKLNVLHLHLSDDQGFRFPSLRYPRLASAEHYRASELRQLVSHAACLGIRVVPELDVPGHTTSWLLAYPEWGSGTAEPSRRFGVHRECLDPTRPAVHRALDELLTEVAEIFPDDYLHLGGDEVHPAWWAADTGIADYMRRHGLGDTAALQARFTRELGELLERRGKRPLGWDEVLHPDVPAGMTVQSWRGATARDRALAAGHDCVVSAHYYLDLGFPADVHYAFDPAAPEPHLLAVEDDLLRDPRFAHVAQGMAWTHQWREYGPVQRPAPAPPGRLLGAEACLWAELVDERVLDVRLWSRMPALAERFWSPASCRDTADMYRRLGPVLERLPQWAGVDVAGDSRRLMAAAGVTEPWWPLVAVLEPVKWYGRLLGEQALAARLEGSEMPKARPYDADTPLNRVADALPPESLGVRELARLLEAEARGDEPARARLRALAEQWRCVPTSGAGPAELDEAAARLAGLGELVIGVLGGFVAPEQARATVAAAARPMGEYILAAALAVAAWLDARAPRRATVMATPAMREPARDAALAPWTEPSQVTSIAPLGDGHINDTWLVVVAGQRWVLQRINERVFPQPGELMVKVAHVVAHLQHTRSPDAVAVPGLIPTLTGADWHEDAQRGVWRVWEYVSRTRTLQALETVAQAEAAGRAFGALQLALADLPAAVPDPIPGFLQLGHYLGRLDAAVAACEPEPQARAALAAVAARRDLAGLFGDRDRLIHGDCKIDNLLFHEQRDAVACVIDLDTVMRGHWAWDFGDLVRSAAADGVGSAAPVGFSVERYAALARGFVGSGAVARDPDSLVLAPRYVALMLAVRFLTDHLDGDRYFKVAARGENLLRARQQLELLGAMEAQEREMAEVASRA